MTNFSQNIRANCLNKTFSASVLIFLFLILGPLTSMFLLTRQAPSIALIYGMSLLVGFSAGYWVLTLTTAAEHFGTNLRATVATTVPNFIRGALVPMTTLFAYFKPDVGSIVSAGIVGGIVFVLSLGALFFLEETYHRDLDFTES